MRQIKFKVWSALRNEWITNMCMIGALNGDLCTHHIETDEEHTFVKHHVHLAYTLEPIVCQFTGLYDKNDNEIYEGDIVRTPKGDLRKIIYEFNSFKTVPLDDNFKDDTVWYYNVEIIGNIHENKQ